ncbi:MAG TPA: hypothetical protein VGI45_26255 [Terracidiphilus sp.]|jgi:hypothetical protein
MEERPAETVALIRGFLDASPQERLSPAEYGFPARGNPGTGSSGVADIRTIILKEEPSKSRNTNSFGVILSLGVGIPNGLCVVHEP